jgi:hypothetical protein
MQTVNHFFNLEEASKEWVPKVAESQEFKEIKAAIRRELKGFQVPPSFYEMLIRQLADGLDVGIGDILVGAWRKRQEIIRYRDTEKYPPDQTNVVPLIEHTVTSKHSPTIQPVINNVPLKKIKFDIVLKLKLKGVMLKIRGGKIMEILVGSCTGSGSIEYAGYAVLKKETQPFNLPASMKLEDGVAI